MNAGNIAAKVARIEKRFAKRRAKRNAAIRRLAASAGAAFIIREGKIRGLRLRDGSVVCFLFRYASERAAIDELKRIAKYARAGDKHLPSHRYCCADCNGWHLSA